MNREKSSVNPNVKAACEIKFEDVSFQYEGTDRPILNHINLTIHKGEKLALVGNNGAGKTTLIKLACGLLPPKSGKIFFNGIDISEYNRDEYYKMISASFQNVCLLPMSIAMNVGYNNENSINREKLHKAVKLAGLEEKLLSLPYGMDTELVPSVTEGGINLSGGETQKLMLACAIFKEAPLIIMDEPTAALDPIAEQEMYLKSVSYTHLGESPHGILLSLLEKGLVYADSFVPVRQWLDRDKIKKATARQRVNARVMALQAGRWDVVRPQKETNGQEWERCFDRSIILCRETVASWNMSWQAALSVLRIREYTGQVRSCLLYTSRCV